MTDCLYSLIVLTDVDPIQTNKHSIISRFSHRLLDTVFLMAGDWNDPGPDTLPSTGQVNISTMLHLASDIACNKCY